MKRMLVGLAGLAVLVGAAPATAHHSAAMFDRNKTVNLVGTVKEVQWTNPHAWIEVIAAPAGDPKPVQWAVEFAGGPQSLIRMGMTKADPKVGDKITISVHPVRDGRPAGSFISMVLANGRNIGGGPGPQAPAPAAPGPQG